MKPSWIRHIGAQLGLIGKMTLALWLGALLMALVAGISWLSFDRVAVLQRRIIDNTVPTMEAVGAVTQLTPSTLALFHQLKLSRTVDEARLLEKQGIEQLDQLNAQLSRLEQQSFEPDLLLEIKATLGEIRANLVEQAATVQVALQLDARMRAGLLAQQHAVKELMLLAEALAANASAYTSATVSSLYPMLEQRTSRNELLTALDWLIEVDIDRMERMSELQLVCFRLKTVLERIDGAGTPAAIQSLSSEFAADLSILSLRIQDFRDPTRKALAERHQRILVSTLAHDGLFALQAQRVVLAQAQDALRQTGSNLALRLNEKGGALLEASRLRVQQVGAGSREVIGRGALGFLAVGGILVLTLSAAFWLLYRYEFLGRLKSLEGAMGALMNGNYDIRIEHSGRRFDPLEPIVRALEQFRTHAIERERLEQSLRQHQQQLESQVLERTAELSHSKTLLEREVELHAQARNEAEEAHRAKNEFLGSLSHELRTPLSGVKGSVQLLRDTALDSRQREYVRMIDYASSTLLETLEDVLGFSRLEAGKLEIIRETFSLADVVDDMLALQSVIAHAKGVALVRDFAKGLPQQLVGDRPKLNQILLNTIGNAVKFTDEGEVTVRVESIAVPVSDGVHLVFHVSDTGVGIPAEQQEAVFNAFYQVSDAAHSRPGGTGLGLAICQRLVELMGGRIWLHSVEGKGTTISFELPFGLPCDAAQPLVEEGAEPERPSRPLTVLVVEDDEINRIVCQRYLESLGHHAHATDSGPAALAWLRQHGAPDCVLMDMSLPGESGLDVTQAIREAGGVHWRDVPIVGMSAHVSAQTLDHPAAATLAGFLTKPFQRRELGKVLAQAVQGSGGVAPTLETVATPDGTCLDQGYLRRELEDLGRDTLVHLAQLFQGEARSALEALRAAAVSQDGAQAGMIAHKLRSAAGNLGFTGVVETCGRIERVATADPGASLQHLIAQLETSIDRAVRALVQWLDGPPQGEHAPSASI